MAEDVIVFGGLFLIAKVGQIVHFEMFFVAPLDDFVRPDEKHAGKEVGARLKARLIAELLVDLELLLRGFLLILLHYKNL